MKSSVIGFSPYERERLVIGQVLAFGEETTQYVLPQLTSDKFLFSEGGLLGSKDHVRIWEAIELAVLRDRIPPTVGTIAGYLQNAENKRHYLASLESAVRGFHRIYAADAEFLRALAEAIDTAGIVYNEGSSNSELVRIIGDTKLFADYVNEVEDVDEWYAERVGRVRRTLKPTEEGYLHISDASERAIQRAYDIRDGKRSLLLPVGWPSFERAGLFVEGEYSIIHGASGGGKSALVMLVALGVAIGLKLHNIPGCVAINSLEMSDESLSERLAASLAGFNRHKLLQGPIALEDEDFGRYIQCLKFVKTLPIYIDPTNFIKTSVMQYRLTGMHYTDKGPVRLLVADYAELFADEESGNKEQNLDRISRRLKTISTSMGITSLLVNQTTYGNDGDNKARIGGFDGVRYKSPRFAADTVLEVWNPIAMLQRGTDVNPPDNLDDSHMWLLVQKGRNYGVADPVKLNWEAEYTRVSDPTLESGLLYSHMRHIDMLIREDSDGSSF